MWASSSITQSMDDFEIMPRDPDIQQSIYMIRYKNPATGDIVEMYELTGVVLLNGERVDKDAQN
jgi:hypothetical protein